MPITKENQPKLNLLTAGEVAETLKMNPQVVARKLKAGEIEGYKLGKDWRVSEEQLLAYLERHANTGGPKDRSEKIVENFIKNGRLTRIPATRSKRLVVLKHLVAKLDSQKVYSEREINDFLGAFHDDVCTLRREMIVNKLMVRNDGRYKRVTWQ
jgi:excisionase family DNA binding protein